MNSYIERKKWSMLNLLFIPLFSFSFFCDTYFTHPYWLIILSHTMAPPRQRLGSFLRNYQKYHLLLEYSSNVLLANFDFSISGFHDSNLASIWLPKFSLQSIMSNQGTKLRYPGDTFHREKGYGERGNLSPMGQYFCWQRTFREKNGGS